MSERPEWMPSISRILELAHAGNSPDAWEWECNRTGLRARLAVLESLIEGQTGHMVDRAKKMIEEIRKELE